MLSIWCCACSLLQVERSLKGDPFQVVCKNRFQVPGVGIPDWSIGRLRALKSVPGFSGAFSSRRSPAKVNFSNLNSLLSNLTHLQFGQISKYSSWRWLFLSLPVPHQPCPCSSWPPPRPSSWRPSWQPSSQPSSASSAGEHGEADCWDGVGAVQGTECFHATNYNMFIAQTSLRCFFSFLLSAAFLGAAVVVVVVVVVVAVVVDMSVRACLMK